MRSALEVLDAPSRFDQNAARVTHADPVVEVSGFAKSFLVGFRRRRFTAAYDISLRVERGEIFGFLGPNGAGKTTTIKALLGLIRPDSGKLSVLGHEPSSMAWRARVGYMPEHPSFFEFLTGRELVTWFGRLSGLTAAEAKSDAERLLERVGLGGAMNRRLRGYSKGMLQRAGLAQALVGHPELLILDEPMTGLDPIGRKEIRELILSLKDEGTTVFYSTHILPDVEMTCDRVSIIHQGRTSRTGRLDQILSETTRSVSIVLSDLAPEQVQNLREGFGAVPADGAWRVEIEDVEAARQFCGEMTQNGAKLLSFQPHRDDLESIFLKSLSAPQQENHP